LEDFDLLFGEAMNSQAKGDVEMKQGCIQSARLQSNEKRSSAADLFGRG
jgi:hypothetical protein